MIWYQTSDIVKSGPPVMFNIILFALSISISKTGDPTAFRVASSDLDFPGNLKQHDKIKNFSRKLQ